VSAASSNPFDNLIDKAIEMGTTLGAISTALTSGNLLDTHAKELRAIWQDIATVSGGSDCSIRRSLRRAASSLEAWRTG
jgi:hypothetical protein